VRERRNLRIRGVVQGVFFRETARRIAAGYDVSGFVRNVGSDALEIEAEGEPSVVAAFFEKVLARPPHGARIDDVRSTAVQARGDEGFVVMPSIRRSLGAGKPR
jgi:acylphosphatase